MALPLLTIPTYGCNGGNIGEGLDPGCLLNRSLEGIGPFGLHQFPKRFPCRTACDMPPALNLTDLGLDAETGLPALAAHGPDPVWPLEERVDTKNVNVAVIRILI